MKRPRLGSKQHTARAALLPLTAFAILSGACVVPGNQPGRYHPLQPLAKKRAPASPAKTAVPAQR